MRRKSRIGVLIRLANLDESRALQTLGRARVRVGEIESAIDVLRIGIAGACAGTILRPGVALAAGDLSLAARSGQGLESRRLQLATELVPAREATEAARESVVQAKLRTRTLKRVKQQRVAHESLLERREEIRQLDELQRGRPAAGEIVR